MSAINDGPGAGHLGELAELHALGVLEPQERARVELHARRCARCARALGEAEATVARLTEAFVPPLEPSDRLSSRIAASAQAVVPLGQRPQPRRAVGPASGFLAAAAALLLAVGIGGGVLLERSAEGGRAARESAALATIATSHFNHLTLTARTPAAPVSKVLYARDGAWFYLVIDGATCDCRVVVHSAAGARDLGKPEARAGTATLFARDLARPASLELVDASGRVISSAVLVYPAK